MMIIRDLLRDRHDLKVILMSATLNADLFSDYFGGCPVIDIPGNTFDIKKNFLTCLPPAKLFNNLSVPALMAEWSKALPLNAGEV